MKIKHVVSVSASITSPAHGTRNVKGLGWKMRREKVSFSRDGQMQHEGSSGSCRQREEKIS
ncbi:hypothetical protein SESBI_19521 [Sesbania bispinosa]|nr:hypothetical protein SESBI_19521 [Sesbania bispinosa]